MIGSLRGVVLERGLDGIVLLEVGGVGYNVVVSTRTLPELEPTTSVFLHVHHHIREDGQTLYGFAGRDERTTFQTLIATHGVGPALAMAILATHPPAALFDIVASGDVGALTMVPGVGKKTAERLLVELKNRLSIPVLDAVGGGGGSAVPRSATCARRWPGSATPRRRSARRCASCRPTATRPRCCATPSSSWGPAVRDEFLDPGVGNDIEEVLEAGLRPRLLAEFVGQRELKEHLGIVIEAARRRGQAVDHLLFAGPPGLGKTTLAGIAAAEMGVTLHITSGPALERAGDLAAILTKLEERDVLFIDEIHRLSRAVEEILYPAMEDFQLDIVVGKGPAASSIRLTLPPFTLVGATTRTGMITGPLRDRFGLVARLDYYDAAELEPIVVRAAGILGVTLDTPGAWEIARRSRGTPRIANRLLRRVRDFAEVRGDGTIDAATAREGLAVFGVDDRGLDKVDRAILTALCQQFRRRPGRAVDAGHLGRRADRDRRGRLRAVPHPAGPHRPHPPRAGRHAGVVRAPRPDAAAARAHRDPGPLRVTMSEVVQARGERVGMSSTEGPGS